MTTMNGVQAISAYLLPRFFVPSLPGADGRAQAGPAAGDRFVLSGDDLSDPDKRALFTGEARQKLPLLHRQSELWEDDEHADAAFRASRELAASIDNWAKAAVDSAIVMSTITDLAKDPAISAAMLPAMKAMAEANNGEVYSLLVAFAGLGVPDALGQAKTLILANRLGVDSDRYGWADQLGLVLAVRHFRDCKPVRVTGTIEHLKDPETNPVPVEIAQDLVAKFDDLKDLEAAVHESLRLAHDYFEYLYNDGASDADKERIRHILIALSSTDSENLETLSKDDVAFLNRNMNLPVIAMLRCMGYHAEVNQAWYDQLEEFARRGMWTMFADENLQVLDGEFEID